MPVLSAGDLAGTIAGPAIVERADTTIVVPARSDVTADAAGNVRIALA